MRCPCNASKYLQVVMTARPSPLADLPLADLSGISGDKVKNSCVFDKFRWLLCLVGNIYNVDVSPSSHLSSDRQRNVHQQLLLQLEQGVSRDWWSLSGGRGMGGKWYCCGTDCCCI